jgi:hypothetical protein
MCALSDRSSEMVRGAISVRLPALRRLGPPRLQLPAETPVAGEIVRFSDDAERATGGGIECCPAVPTVVAYPGWRGRMFMCPLSQTGAMGQTRPLRRPEEQPLSRQGRTLPP